MNIPADRNLLFGLFALQNGVIGQSALVAAFHAWTRDKSRSIAEILLDQGAIDADDRTLLEGLVTKHLKRHGEDVEKSLAAVAAPRSVVKGLIALGDENVNVTLGHFGSGSHPTAPDDDRVDADATTSLGRATSDGQRFRILRPHARGGLGAVFVALDAELNREVALKQILDHHADDPTSRTRFRIEAEITGRLEHPGIVPVYGLGQYGDGRPYYAMRFIRGDSLKDAIASFHADLSLEREPGKKSLELRKLLRCFVDVCNAVGYAHGRGVLHRDLKPGNVIVGRHGETLVVDWGLAKPTGQSEARANADERTLMPSSSSGSTDTLPGSAIGTPGYMSPEQAAGNLERLGPRSDVYSLGATLYCLLTGKVPFEGSDIGAVLDAVRNGHFPPPRHVDPTIDAALEAVCLKAMSTTPEDRYASARLLTDDIERWMADEPVTAWAEPLARRAQRWARRNRSLVTAAGAAVLMATAGLGAVLAVQSRANGRLQAANLELTRSNEREAAANANLVKANAREHERFELAREAIRSFQDGVNEEDMLKGEALKGLRNKLLKSAAGFYEKLERLLQGQTDRKSKVMLAQSYSELGDLTEKIANRTEALAIYRKALAIRRELAGSPEADTAARLDLARSLLQVGGVANGTGDPGLAMSAGREARELTEPVISGPGATEEAREVLGSSVALIGSTFLARGELEKALVSSKDALAIRRKLVADHPTVARYQETLADALGALAGMYDTVQRESEAMAAYGEALAISRKLAEDNPIATGPRGRLAQILNNTGNSKLFSKPTEALPMLREASDIIRRLLRDQPAVSQFRYTLATVQTNIGMALANSRHPDQAMAAYGEALVIYRKLVEDNPAVTDFRFQMAGCLGLIAGTKSATGHAAEALTDYREVLTTLRKLNEDHPNILKYEMARVEFHLRLSLALAEISEYAAATDQCRQAVAIARKLPPETFFLYGLACAESQLAGSLAREGSGKSGEAEDAAEAAVATLRRAIGAGYRDLPTLKIAQSLNPIRARANFQLLLSDLSFPADVFAR